jgi:hypothetical protein
MPLVRFRLSTGDVSNPIAPNQLIRLTTYAPASTGAFTVYSFPTDDVGGLYFLGRLLSKNVNIAKRVNALSC